MTHGRALQYVGDGSRWVPGIPRMDLLPSDEDGLPEGWTFAKLVATGDYAWAPVAEVAAAEEPAEASVEAPAPKRRG